MLANLDLFIVNVALPRTSRPGVERHGQNLGNYPGSSTGYAIVYAALLVFCGRLAERFPQEQASSPV